LNFDGCPVKLVRSEFTALEAARSNALRNEGDNSSVERLLDRINELSGASFSSLSLNENEKPLGRFSGPDKGLSIVYKTEKQNGATQSEGP
jgi:hypothetical protein